MSEKYEIIIGLEIHAQLKTNSKIFAGDSTSFGKKPNTNVSVVTLAHPGTLPKTNKKAVEFAIKMGIATNCHINQKTLFARKNYFYPDLPKGFQTTQDKNPICENGFLTIELKNKTTKNIRIQRIHLEEDAGKSLHLDNEKDTLIDFNRAGVPLIEIVSHPDLRSGEEASVYMQEIRKIVKYLDICDGNMEEGSLRCDANVSVRLKNENHLNTRTEIKNLNSFRFLQKAIEYEAKRQIELIENDKQNEIIQETRGFDAVKEQTFSMREKENLNDYRYFPEPDLAPLLISDEWLKNIQENLPELPQKLLQRLIQQYQLSDYDAQRLIENKEIVLFFEETSRLLNDYKSIVNWILETIKPFWVAIGIENNACPINSKNLIDLIVLVNENKINNSAAQKIFSFIIKNPSKTPLEIAKEENLLIENNENELETQIKVILEAFPDKVKEYRNGKKGLLSMFMGELMKKNKGKLNVKAANELLIEKLKK